jgi:hypothetical protein
MIILFVLYACVPQQDDLATLAKFTTGTFSTAEQARADTNFADISLHQARIWSERTDGYWFYVEQAEAENAGKPYRQRVYHLEQTSDSTFTNTVYTMANPQKYIGAWKQSAAFSEMTPDALKEREGCAVILQKYGEETFVGSTESLRCDSNLRGAAYATSIVLITPNQIYSWDRGFDLNGQQVWGAQAGGYIFKKQPAQN